MKNKLKKYFLVSSVWFVSLLPAKAEFLFNQYLTPGFVSNPNTEFSHWDVFFAPNGGQNYPDKAAPNGTYQTASAAGFSNPGDWSPLNPLAYWHLDNPTITQTNGGHFIIGPATAGNIYSFSTFSAYDLEDSTPYTLGTVVFQFQSEGTAVDFSSIKLRYNTGSGNVDLAPNEFIREYRAGTSSFGGFSNRNALQWDLTGLGVNSYNIIFQSLGSSMSFQEALLDTSGTYAAVVPAKRTWIGTGAQSWSIGSNWLEGSTSAPNGNVRFENAGNTVINLDGDRSIAEFTIATPNNTTITGTSKLTVNTGITAGSSATGTTTIEVPYELGAYNLMRVNAGTVKLSATVSGSYGLTKTGSGTLILSGTNTFGTATAGMGVQGGTLRIEGSNNYGGSTSVLWGTIQVASNAPASGAGAFGNASSPVLVGASSSLFSGVPEPAQIVIDGNYTVARNINIEVGTFDKRLGSINSSTEAVYSGSINLLGTAATASNLKLFAQGATDTTRFSGNISGGGATKALEINTNGEQGTVIFSGSNKSYASQTIIGGGKLLLASGVATTGNGAWIVGSGATLHVNGTLGGTGALTLSANSTLTGSGFVNKSFTVGAGALISPGNSPGTLSTGSQIWSDGGVYLWEINDVDAGVGTSPGWDFLNISGTLNINATSASPFTIKVQSLNLANSAGLVHDFNDLSNYSWTIATATGGISGFSASNFNLDLTGFLNSYTGTFSLIQSGNSLLLNYAAIPEPSTLLLVIVSCAGICMMRRSRKR